MKMDRRALLKGLISTPLAKPLAALAPAAAILPSYMPAATTALGLGSSSLMFADHHALPTINFTNGAPIATHSAERIAFDVKTYDYEQYAFDVIGDFWP
jgi:hypothetical protein